MPIELIPAKENHGVMPWTGEFDDQARALFECPICGRIIALGGPAEKNYTMVVQGEFYASHQAYVTFAVWKAALEQELWPQQKGMRGLFKAWEKAPGELPFTISEAQMRPSDD